MPGFDVKMAAGPVIHIEAADEDTAMRVARDQGVPQEIVKPQRKKSAKKSTKKSTKKAAAKAPAKKPEASGANTPSQQLTRTSNTKPGETTSDVVKP
jgi:hypothetical protein